MEHWQAHIFAPKLGKSKELSLPIMQNFQLKGSGQLALQCAGGLLAFFAVCVSVYAPIPT